MHSFEYHICTLDGPNGSGKTATGEIARSLLGLYFQQELNLIHDVEPPNLPVVPIPEDLKDEMENFIGMTWRRVLKKGEGESYNNDEIGFATGFLSARADLESWYRNPSVWGEDLKPCRLLMRDRSTPSTLVYQSGQEGLIRQYYEQGILQKDLLTILQIPSSQAQNTWATGNPEREQDIDVHDTDRMREIQKYLDLREKGVMFTNNLIYVENDPSGKTNCLETIGLLIFIVTAYTLAHKKLQRGDTINFAISDLFIEQLRSIDFDTQCVIEDLNRYRTFGDLKVISASEQLIELYLQ